MRTVFAVLALTIAMVAAGDGEWHRAKVYEKMPQHSDCVDCDSNEDRTHDGKIVIHPVDGSGFDASTPHACCHVCPPGCDETTCFHKCERKCGDECKLSAATGAAGSTSSPKKPVPEFATEPLAATGSASSDPCADPEAECIEPEEISEDDVETIDSRDAEFYDDAQPNDPRDPEYQSSTLQYKDEDQVTYGKEQVAKKAAHDAKRRALLRGN